jgi:hypothetical protein
MFSDSNRVKTTLKYSSGDHLIFMKVNGHTSFFLNVEEGKLFPNKDFDASV